MSDEGEQTTKGRDPATGRWLPGHAPPGAGRPRGARHKATLAAEALLDGEAAALTRKAIEKAKEGDTVALRLCLERILPARKDRPVRIDLPKLTSASDATAALAMVAEKMAAGEVTPDEGASVNAVIGGFIRAHEITTLESRLRALEDRLGEKGDRR
jgi:uncharacterized protein DUF5681